VRVRAERRCGGNLKDWIPLVHDVVIDVGEKIEPIIPKKRSG
jgi:hypothetical protein